MNLLTVGMAALLAALVWTGAVAEVGPTHVDVFKAGEGGYAVFRIPALEVAPDGSLLAFAEARKHNAGDPGMSGNEIDLVLKRSVDGGRTWSPITLIEHAGERWSSANPATVVDRSTRRVWLLILRCRPGRSTETARAGTDDVANIARWSADNGRTWSDPVDITPAARDMADPAWACTVIGPGGAIQTRSGRLLAPAWSARPYRPLAVYSDDHGRTWRHGNPVPGPGGNECQVAELPDGRIVMDIRQNRGPDRYQALSADGGETWSEARASQPLSMVSCAIEAIPGRRPVAPALLWTGPRGPGRRNLVARISRDAGGTFCEERLLAAEEAAYSDLALLKGGDVGLLWERRDHRDIAFARLPRAWLRPPGK